MFNFMFHLFDTKDFPARWYCGTGWSDGLGWTHILSDVAIWAAYFTIPLLILYFAQNRRDLPFRSIFFLFGAFILFCGMTHLMDAAIFWWPAYRFAGLLKLLTAVVSCLTVVALIPAIPQALALRSPAELEREIAERKRVEEKLLHLQHDLEQRFEERTNELRRNEEHLRLALGAGQMGTWEWNTITNDFRWTGHLAEIHGSTQGDFAVSFDEFVQGVHAGDRERLRATIQQAAKTKSAFETEYRILWPDGTIHWIAGKGSAAHNQSGDVLRLIGIGLDITKQKQAEFSSRFLANASAALASLVDHESTLQKVATLAVPEFADWCALDMLDDQGVLQRVAAAHIDSRKVKMVFSLAKDSGFDPNAADGVPAVVRTGKTVRVEQIEQQAPAHYSASDAAIVKELGLRSYMCLPVVVRGQILGAISFVNTEASRCFDAADELVAQDVAGRAAAALESARLYSEVRKADRQKDEFLALLAHELRNPLAPIGNALRALSLPNLDAEAATAARGIIERQFQQLVRLVDDLLDISRIVRGKIALRSEVTTLSSIVDRAVETSRPMLDANRHELSIQLPETPLELEVDPVRMSQVLSNLLNNSSKFTEPGGKIAIVAAVDESDLRITVRDNGIGLSREMLPQVFELFKQVDSTLKRAQGGLGIGLTIVKNIVTLLEGEVTMRSDGIGKGCEVTIRLPLLRITPLTRFAPTSAQKLEQSKRRILIVDDNVDSADTLSLLLRTQSHEVTVAYDGPTALELASKMKPDLVVLDIGMPGMDGYEVARKLRESPRGRELTIIALTGWGGKDDRRRTSEAGFDHHLVKPVQIDDLNRVTGYSLIRSASSQLTQ